MVLTAPLDDPAAWSGADLLTRDDWTVSFTDRHLEEVEAAMRAITAQGRPLFEVTQADFPLPTLSPLLARQLAEIEGGRGFVKLRSRLPVESWSEEQARLAFWGLGTHLGWAEGQDGAGNLLHDVRDVGRPFGSDDTIRYFQTNQAIDFHNDGADIFALCCRRAGSAGGRSRLISAVEVFNEIARRDPALAVVLQEDFHFDARGQRSDGSRCQVLPVYAFHDGLLNVLLKTPYVLSAQRFEEVPRLTEAQQAALALLDEVMEKEGLALEFDLEPGDILVASNHVVLHGRTAFVDGGVAGEQRHMLRLWLTIPNGRSLPPHYADTREFGATYARRITGSVAGDGRA